MKFRCERDVLAEALGTAGRAVASGAGALPVLSGIKAELRGRSADARRQRPRSHDPGRPAVAGDDDGDRGAARSWPPTSCGRSSRAPSPSSATATRAASPSGRSQFAVRMLPADDFPAWCPPPAAEVTLDAEELAEALRQVVRAASSDDARPILTGVLMAAEGDGLRLVATDSYRLAVRDLPGTSVLREGQSVLVPSRALAELQRLLTGAEDVTLRLAEHDATFEVGDVRLTTRLIEGEFPNYRQLIPSAYPNRAIVGKEPLLDAVRRVKLLAREATPVRIALKADGLELTAITQDVGQATEDVDAKYEGAEMTVAFNPDYLIDGVEAIAGDEVQLETLDALKPAPWSARSRAERLPVPAHARPGVLSPCA